MPLKKCFFLTLKSLQNAAQYFVLELELSPIAAKLKREKIYMYMYFRNGVFTNIKKED